MAENVLSVSSQTDLCMSWMHRLSVFICDHNSHLGYYSGKHTLKGLQHSFVEIDHEIFSMVILSLPLIQEGQLSISGKRLCTILVNCLED